MQNIRLRLLLVLLPIGLPCFAAAPAAAPIVLADFVKSPGAKPQYVERGELNFADTDARGFVFKPVNFACRTLVFLNAPGRPAQNRATARFTLPDLASSFGLQVGGGGESEPSYLILVRRDTLESGTLRGFRAPLWPTDSFTKDQVLGPDVFVGEFPDASDYNLSVSAAPDPKGAGTTITATLTDAETGRVIVTAQFRDAKASAPLAGSVAARLFGAPNSSVILKSISLDTVK